MTNTITKAYEVNKVIRFTEEDIYKDGCQPNTGTSDVIRVNIKANTVKELLEKLFSELCFDYDLEAVELNACDEDGRIDISVMEDENGSEASERQLKEWKEGKRRLWYGVYSARVKMVTRETVELKMETK